MEAYLQGIVIWIYRQRPKHLIEYAVYAAMIFGILCRRLKGTRWVRICLRAMLVCWFAAILWITVFCRQSGGSYDAYWIPLHSYPYFFNEEYELTSSGAKEFAKGLTNLDNISRVKLEQRASKLKQEIKDLGEVSVNSIQSKFDKLDTLIAKNLLSVKCFHKKTM